MPRPSTPYPRRTSTQYNTVPEGNRATVKSPAGQTSERAKAKRAVSASVDMVDSAGNQSTKPAAPTTPAAAAIQSPSTKKNIQAQRSEGFSCPSTVDPKSVTASLQKDGTIALSYSLKGSLKKYDDFVISINPAPSKEDIKSMKFAIVALLEVARTTDANFTRVVFKEDGDSQVWTKPTSASSDSQPITIMDEKARDLIKEALKVLLKTPADQGEKVGAYTLDMRRATPATKP